jgi:hypothetical protein
MRDEVSKIAAFEVVSCDPSVVPYRDKDKTKTRRMVREASMELKEAGSADLERLCQAVSPSDEPCDYPATVHCAKCGRWFCDAHAEDQEWHQCMLLLSEKEGGEA